MPISLRIIFAIPLLVITFLYCYVTIKYTNNSSPNGFEEYFIAFIATITIILCIISLIYLLVNPKRIFIFNRMEGTLTMPISKWKWLDKTTVTINFKDGCFFSGASRRNNVIRVMIPNSRFAFDVYVSKYAGMGKKFSPFVWYMDKNRPLPPGKELDPYREKDYERRKAEGFPKPLYPSQIKIPEWEGVKSI